MIEDSKIYYDYKKDFPIGNGWIKSCYDYSYKGVIIDSPSFIFETGKYKGKTLQEIIELCWRGVIKYIDYGLIHITKNCFDNLYCSEPKKSSIMAANDAKLEFCKIYSINDEIYSKPYACNFQGEIFIDVVRNNPKYLAMLLRRGFMPRYGFNQKFYAVDRSDTLTYGNVSYFSDEKCISTGEKWVSNILSQLGNKGINNELTKFLKNLDSYLEECLEDAHLRRIEAEERYWAEEDLRYYQNEGYWDAFDGNPDAEWNID